MNIKHNYVNQLEQDKKKKSIIEGRHNQIKVTSKIIDSIVDMKLAIKRLERIK